MTVKQAEKIKRYCTKHPIKTKDIRIDDMSWRGVDFYNVAIFYKTFEKGCKRYHVELFVDLVKNTAKEAVMLFNKQFELAGGSV